jgi:hypothetical protein
MSFEVRCPCRGGIHAGRSPVVGTTGYPSIIPPGFMPPVWIIALEGDVELDPFCGCGAAVHAAQKLNRKWIGIDMTASPFR